MLKKNIRVITCFRPKVISPCDLWQLSQITERLDKVICKRYCLFNRSLEAHTKKNGGLPRCKMCKVRLPTLIVVIADRPYPLCNSLNHAHVRLVAYLVCKH